MDTPVISITVPYIPLTGLDGQIPHEPSDFEPTLKMFGKRYHLREIEGSRLVWDKNEGWVEIGFNAIYRREVRNGKRNTTV